MTDTSVKPSVSSIPAELLMDDDTTADEQAYSSSGEDIGHDHIPMVNLRQSWWKPLTEDRPGTPEPAYSKWKNATNFSPIKWPIQSSGHVTIQPNFFFNKDLEYLWYGHKIGKPALSLSKMKAAYYPDVSLEQMVPDQMLIDEECKYDVAAMYGIYHWWFERQRFYIDRHTSEGDRKAVRTHMRILSVVRIEVLSLYGYNYMKKIVLRRADLKEYVIAERDFKYLYPNNFEDLNLVIKQRVEDFQLGIESYQTQLNLTKPRWDATGFEYKHDFTVIDSPSDGTLQQIDKALDYRVKEFKVNRMNPGLQTWFWTKKDVNKSKEFMFAIEKWLKTRRIFRNLESFIGGRIREGDYRLLKRTE
ncbi:hypothetical protein Tco_0895560 [Tanacetum coccineum]|uniref:Uncharacterized protein n=1 Tax=Tanacetum coccineum TaxID=301880 RepID=A0ABQ5CHH1_9ASTR